MGTLVRPLACSVVVSFLFASGALAQNFFRLSQEKGCESVMQMDHLRDECNALNEAKDKVCGPGTCDIDAHTKQIEKYNADLAQVKAGGIADADLELLKASIEKTKTELDQRKSEAEANERGARACMVARQNVYDFFENKVIPATLQAAADLKTQREGLLKELDNAEVLQASAKDRRDELAGADPERDRARWDEYVRMQAEYETNTAAYREVENKLGQFNSMYGNDIDDGVYRLIKYYRAEQEGHKIAIDQQKNIFENCDKVGGMSY